MNLPHLIDLRRLTLEDHGIRRGLADGTLIRLTPEIAVSRIEYRSIPPWNRTLLVARAVGMGASTAVLTGKAAARVSGIAVRGWNEPVALAYPSGSPPPPRDRQPGIRYLRSRIEPREVTEIDGVRVAKLPRYLRDIARLDGLVDAVVTVDSIRRTYSGVDEAWLRHHCTDDRRFAGITTLREAIRLSSPLAESPLESEARVRLVLADVGEVKEQVGVGGHRVDLLVDDETVVEVDGAVKYDGVTFGRPVDEVLRAERRREKELQNAGYTVIRIGAEHLKNEGAELIRLVRRAQRRRASASRPGI